MEGGREGGERSEIESKSRLSGILCACVCRCVSVHACVYTHNRREEKRVLHIGQEVDLLQ